MFKQQQPVLHVYAEGHFPKYLPELPPLPLDPFEVRLDRAIRIALTVVSAGTGEPLRQIVGKMEHEQVREAEVARVTYRSWSVFKEDGILPDIDCPAGRVYITVEAPGHAEKELQLDLDPAERQREVTVALDPAPEPPPDEEEG